MKLLLVLMVALFVVFNAFLVVRYLVGASNAIEVNTALKEKRIVLSPVDKVELLPLVDFESNSKELRTEAGLSYLVKAGEEQVLFDVGYNKKAEKVSPLVYNMEKLGIDLQAIDALVISHNHADHVGGLKYRYKRVELTKGAPVDLQNRPLYAPVALSSDTARSITVTGPRLITDSIGTSGPLMGQLFIFGATPEQALLIDVNAKGIVLVSGCGHPQILEMVESAIAITGQKVYAVVGGLHLFCTEPFGGKIQQILGSNRLFSGKPTSTEIERIIGKLKTLGVEKVYVSPHDADEATMELFAKGFGTSFGRVKVGEKIIL